MGWAGEIIGWVIVIAGSGAFIHWLDFIQRNLPDALDYRAGKFTDRLETPWGDVVNIPSELRPARNSGGGGVHNGGRAGTKDVIARRHGKGL